MTKIKGRDRRKCRILRRILTVILCAALVFASIMLTVAFVCSAIFARADGQNMYRQYSDANSIDHPRTQVSFSSGKNTLQGYLYEVEEPQGLVITVHGMHGDSDSHLSEAFYFVDSGFSVFSFDGTGTGDSTGRTVVGLQQMVPDLTAAIKYISAEPRLSELPILLYGHSMGGYAAAVAAASSDNVAAVVSIAGFDSPMEVMLNSGKRMCGDVAIIGYPFLYLYNKMVFGSDVNRSAVDAINRSDAAFLIVYGADDRVIHEEESIYGNRDGIVNPDVSYCYVEDELRSGHNGAWLTSEAVAYRTEAEDALLQMEEAQGDELTKEAFADFYGGLDHGQLYELDEAFMSRVVAFYLAAIGK